MTIWELVAAILRETKGVAWEMPVVVNHKGNSFEVERVETDGLGDLPTVVVLTKDPDDGD